AADHAEQVDGDVVDAGLVARLDAVAAGAVVPDLDRKRVGQVAGAEVVRPVGRAARAHLVDEAGGRRDEVVARGDRGLVDHDLVRVRVEAAEEVLPAARRDGRLERRRLADAADHAEQVDPDVVDAGLVADLYAVAAGAVVPD